MALELFAGIPVTDYVTALPWFSAAAALVPRDATSSAVFRSELIQIVPQTGAGLATQEVAHELVPAHPPWLPRSGFSEATGGRRP